ncbi:MAG: hypothetical protein MI754_04890 [Chromatiales bacterium]|nr:hypothetical protein [Chromatiales bacterium]
MPHLPDCLKAMDTCVEFKSDLFKPFLPEDAQANPECYGAELAWWLSRELAKRGIYTTYPVGEDWGWFIEYFVNDNEYWLCCCNTEGSSNHWLVYLDCKAKSLFGRNKAPVSVAQPLLKALSALLSETSRIENIVWSKELA